jgi:tRNA(Ile)-lysidine synthase
MTENPNNVGPWDQLLVEIEDAWPQDRWRDVGVVVGCSGGADSVALLRLLHDQRQQTRELPARGFLVAAHFNHGLRGDESEADQVFVEHLARELDLPFVTERSSSLDCDEASLRDRRYQFLEQTACRLGARYITLAHSRDDNVETVLHHLMRGTGPAGMAGISGSRSLGEDLVVVRPLLSSSRDSIRDGLRSIDQSWREDSSNANIDYRRNWIRRKLIPLIEDEYPCAVDAMARAIETQGEWRATMLRLASEWIEQNRLGDQPLTLTRCEHSDSTIVVAALQVLWDAQGWSRGEMNQTQWLRLVDTLRSKDSVRFALPGDLDVHAEAAQVRIKHAERKEA